MDDETQNQDQGGEEASEPVAASEPAGTAPQAEVAEPGELDSSQAQNDAGVDTPASAEATASEPAEAGTEPPAPAPAPLPVMPKGDLVKARAKIQETKQKKLERIMALVAQKGKITNDEVEKLLHVSDATATRYLTELEKEGRIRQTGRTGKSVFYEKI